MAHPYFHSVSSVTSWGGEVEDYLAIHQWFDRSKQFLGDFRHRALRHHAEGIDLSCRIFGSEIVNSDGVTVAVDQIGRQHVEEDLGRVPTMATWLEAMDHKSLRVKRQLSSLDQATCSADKWGGTLADYVSIHELLDEPMVGNRRLNLLARHHTEGIFLAEEIFGATLTNSDSRVIPVRLVAELHVNNELLRIPPVSEILALTRTAAWMMRVAKPSRVILQSV